MSSSFGKTLNVGFLLLTMALASLVLGASVRAQEGGDDFTYTAEAGDSLTLFVRSSVESLAASDGVDLTDGKLIAAETIIVQDLGGYELNVGQEVTIAKGSVQSGLNKATELTEAEEARWASYGPITRTSERTVAEEVAPEEEQQEPESNEPQEQAPEESSEESETEEAAAVEAQADTEEAPEADSTEEVANVEEVPSTNAVLEDAIGTTPATETTVDTSADDSDDDQAPWYWWVIGGSALGAMWYVLGGGPKQKNAGAKKQNAKTKKKSKK